MELKYNICGLTDHVFQWSGDCYSCSKCFVVVKSLVIKPKTETGVCKMHGRIMLHSGKCHDCRHIEECNKFENERLDSLKSI